MKQQKIQKYFQNKIRNRFVLRQKYRVFITWLSLVLSSVLIMTAMVMPASIKTYSTNFVKGLGPYRSYVTYQNNPANVPFFKFSNQQGDMYYNNPLDPGGDDVPSMKGGVSNGTSWFTNNFGTYDYTQPDIYWNHFFNLSGNQAGSAWDNASTLLNSNSYLGNLLITMQLMDKVSDLSGNDPATIGTVCSLVGTTIEDVTKYMKNQGNPDPKPTVTDVIKVVISQNAPYFLKQKIWNSKPGTADYNSFAIAFGVIPYAKQNDELFTSLTSKYKDKEVSTWAVDSDTRLTVPLLNRISGLSHDDGYIPVVINSPLSSLMNIGIGSKFTMQSSYRQLEYYGYLPNEIPSNSSKDWHVLDSNRIYVQNGKRAGLKPVTYYCLSGNAFNNHTYCNDLDPTYKGYKPNVPDTPDFQHPYPTSLLQMLAAGKLRVQEVPIDLHYQVKAISADTTNLKIYTSKSFINPLIGLGIPSSTSHTNTGLYAGYNAKLTTLDNPLDFSQFLTYSPYGDYSQLGLTGFTQNPDSSDYDPTKGMSLDYWFAGGTPGTPTYACNLDTDILCFKYIPSAAESIINTGYSQSQFKLTFNKIFSIISFVVYLFLVLGLLIGAIIISNSTNSIVQENKKRIATFKLMGYKNKEVVKMTIGVYNLIIFTAILFAIPFSIIIIYGLLDIVNKQTGIYSTIYLGIWELPVAALIILSIYFINYLANYWIVKKYINASTLNEQ